jgi:transposase InsO family protein
MIVPLQQAFPAVSLRQLCAMLEINRSWYSVRRDQPKDRAEHDALVTAVEAIVREFPGYGYRRVTAALQHAGWTINHKRVLRIMREESLVCQIRRHVRTTQSRHPFGRYPNLVRGRAPTGPDQIWVADLTYIRLAHGMGYLACVLDAWSRRCLGWTVSASLAATTSLAALDQALAIRQPAPGWIHHSDQGIHYANHAYVQRLTDHGAQISMAAVGCPTQNALIESFFSTLKREEVNLQEYTDLADARAHLGHFLDDVYNQKRLHSSLGYRPPAAFEIDEATPTPHTYR